MTCIICSSDKWENVDQFREAPDNMTMCLICGFITYSDIIQETLKANYSGFRDKIGAFNYYAAKTKNIHHDIILDDFMINGPVLEIGCGIGSFIHELKTIDNLEVYGTEWDEKSRLICQNVNGIDVTKEPDWSRKYGMIMSYHVAEHQLDINEQLKIYRDHLLDDGILYIGVPTWFGKLCNFGMPGFDFGYYYHKNHINVWSMELFEWMLTKSGFKIEKSRHSFCGSSQYVCTKYAIGDKMIGNRPKITSLQRREELFKIKESAKAYKEKDYTLALDFWPNFPSAHRDFIKDLSNKGKSKTEIMDAAQKALTDCPEDKDVMMIAAKVCLKFNEYGLAKEYFEAIISLDPTFPAAHLWYADLLKAIGKKQEAINHLKVNMFEGSKPIFLNKLYEIAASN